MAIIPYSEAALAAEAAAFAESITPEDARWNYCFARATYIRTSRYGGDTRCINPRTIPVAAKVLGVTTSRARFGFVQLRHSSLAEAKQRLSKYSALSGSFKVGQLQAWQVGHIYFARVKKLPHVVKIGFSRRVLDRVAEIESKVKEELFVEQGQLRVGTLADEHWWHKNWEKRRVAGEWFLDPFIDERTLPDFLAEMKERAA